MNNLSRFLRSISLLLVVMIVSGCLLSRPAAASPSINIFYTQLAPHGNWFDHRTYGRVWQPYGVSRNWRPYTDGRWIYTNDYGWYWEADQEWGWAPFHYGRWAFDSFRGWLWIPGDIWAPAWVSWQYGNGYSSWAPLPPEIYWQPRSGLSFSYSSISSIPVDHWVVMSDRHFGRGRVREHVLPAYQNNIYVNNIHNHVTYVTVNNNRIVNPGVPRAHLEKELGTPIKPVRVKQLNDIPQSGIHKSTNEVQIVRPLIEPKIVNENHERELAAKIVEDNRQQAQDGNAVPATNPVLIDQPKSVISPIKPNALIAPAPVEQDIPLPAVERAQLPEVNELPLPRPVLIDQPPSVANEIKSEAPTLSAPVEQTPILPAVEQVDSSPPVLAPPKEAPHIEERSTTIEKPTVFEPANFQPKQDEPNQLSDIQLRQQAELQQQMAQQRQLEQQQQVEMQQQAQRQAEVQQQQQAQQQMEQQRQLEQQQQAEMQQQAQRQAEVQQQQQVQQQMAQQRQLEQQAQMQRQAEMQQQAAQQERQMRGQRERETQQQPATQ